MNRSLPEPRTFRATPAAWLGQLGLPVLFYGLLSLTAVRALGLNRLVAGIGLGAILLVAGVDYLLPMLRNWLLLDARTIGGTLNGQEFELYWTEIIAAWQFEYGRRHFLGLGTRDGALMVPLRFLDHTAIWERVQQFAQPAALLEDAVRRLPDYQEWARARERILQDGVDPAAGASDGEDQVTAGPVGVDMSAIIIADPWLTQVAGWIGLAGFGFGLLQALRDGQLHLAALFILLAAGSVAVLLSWGVTEFSPERIRRHTLLGGWSLDWDAIRAVEMDPQELALVISADDREVVIPGPWVWGGARHAALALLLAQIEARAIPLRRNPLALFKVSRRLRLGKAQAGKVRSGKNRARK